MPAKRKKSRTDGMDDVVRSIRETRGLSVQIAKACGIERAAVYQWRRVPPHWVNEVAKITKLSPKKIRPDIFR